MSPATPGAALSLRVTVTDAWRTMALRLPAAAPVAEAKRQALVGSGIDARLGDRYQLKFGGTVLADETQRLDAAGIPDGAGLVVCPRRRRAVR